MNCRHENIFWEDFFKPEKQKDNNYHHHDAYCLDCNETKGKLFASKCQTWYCKKIKEWLVEQGLAEKFDHLYLTNNFNEFVKKNNFEEQWNKLQGGRIDDNYGFEGLIGQGVFWESAKSIEHLCLEFKKEKEKDNPNPERERESKIIIPE